MFVEDQQLEVKVSRRCEEEGPRRRRECCLPLLLLVSSSERWVGSKKELLDEEALLEGMDPEKGPISLLGSERWEERQRLAEG